MAEHHGISAYKNSRCRCLQCRAANAEYQRKLREAWRMKRQSVLYDQGGQLLVELTELERYAERKEFAEALGILRMHIRATKLDMSLDAVRRGEV